MIRIYEPFEAVVYRPNDEDGDQDACVLMFHGDGDGQPPVYDLRLFERHGGDKVTNVDADRISRFYRAPLASFRPNTHGPKYNLVREIPVMHEQEHIFFSQVCFEVNRLLADEHDLWFNLISWSFEDRSMPVVEFQVELGQRHLCVQVWRPDCLSQNWSINQTAADPMRTRSFVEWRGNAQAYVINALYDAFNPWLTKQVKAKARSA